MIGRWRFRAWPRAEYAELVDVLDASPEQRGRALEPAAAWALLERTLSTATVSAPNSWELAAIIGGATGITPAPGRRLGDLRPAVEEAIQMRRLLVVPDPYEPPRVAPDLERKKEEPPLDFGAAEEPVAWIEIELVDGRGNAVPDMELTVTGPDGSERRGRTGATGRARYDGILPGTYSVAFLKLDRSSPPD